MRPLQKVLVCSLFGLLLASCAKTMQTAAVAYDPQGRISQHPLVAELDVQERAELTLPRKDLREAADKKEFLATELLKQKGGDVLLEARILGLRPTPYEWPDSVTVSGYPATYARHRNATPEDMERFILPATEGRCGCGRIWNGEASAKVDTFSLGTAVDRYQLTVFKPGFHIDAGFILPQTGIELSCLYNLTPGVGFNLLKIRVATRKGEKLKGRTDDRENELAIGAGVRFSSPRTSGGQSLFLSADLMYEHVATRNVIARDFTAGLYLAKPVYVAYRLNLRSNKDGYLDGHVTHWVKIGLTL